MPDGKFYTGLLVLPLRKTALDGIHGYAEFSELLEAEEADILAFDASFPKRKRKCFPASMSMKLPVHSWMNKRR